MLLLLLAPLYLWLVLLLLLMLLPGQVSDRAPVSPAVQSHLAAAHIIHTQGAVVATKRQQACCETDV